MSCCFASPPKEAEPKKVIVEPSLQSRKSLPEITPPPRSYSVTEKKNDDKKVNDQNEPMMMSRSQTLDKIVTSRNASRVAESDQNADSAVAVESAASISADEPKHEKKANFKNDIADEEIESNVEPAAAEGNNEKEVKADTEVEQENSPDDVLPSLMRQQTEQVDIGQDDEHSKPDIVREERLPVNTE